jgi:hypothetical protein
MSHRPIRIVYFIDTLGFGGTELNAVRLAERLDRDEFAISVACFGDGPLRARLEAARIPSTSTHRAACTARGWCGKVCALRDS